MGVVRIEGWRRVLPACVVGACVLTLGCLGAGAPTATTPEQMASPGAGQGVVIGSVLIRAEDAEDSLMRDIFRNDRASEGIFTIHGESTDWRGRAFKRRSGEHFEIKTPPGREMFFAHTLPAGEYRLGNLSVGQNSSNDYGYFTVEAGRVIYLGRLQIGLPGRVEYYTRFTMGVADARDIAFEVLRPRFGDALDEAETRLLRDVATVAVSPTEELTAVPGPPLEAVSTPPLRLAPVEYAVPDPKLPPLSVFALRPRGDLMVRCFEFDGGGATKHCQTNFLTLKELTDEIDGSGVFASVSRAADDPDYKLLVNTVVFDEETAGELLSAVISGGTLQLIPGFRSRELWVDAQLLWRDRRVEDVRFKFDFITAEGLMASPADARQSIIQTVISRLLDRLQQSNAFAPNRRPTPESARAPETETES